MASILAVVKMGARIRAAVCVFMLAGALCAGAGELSLTLPPLDRGFQLLYNLDFDRAHGIFAAYEQTNPGDPLGPTSDAAGLLFSEFHRLGVLEAQFFEDDKNFNNRPKLDPDAGVRARFNAAVQKAEGLAQTRLAQDPKDKNSLFAMTLCNGLQADYAALIEKRNLVSLHYTKEATKWAEKTLAVDPQYYDAHIAGGISKYLIGSMAAPVRWLVRLGGISGDKQEGVKELKLVAERGHYLAPFADVLLAIAYVRDHDKQHARELLAQLHEEFPANPLFPQEIARLDGR